MIEVPITLTVDARAGSGNWFKPAEITVRDSNGGGVEICVKSKASIARGSLPPIMVQLTRYDAEALLVALCQQLYSQTPELDFALQEMGVSPR